MLKLAGISICLALVGCGGNSSAGGGGNGGGGGGGGGSQPDASTQGAALACSALAYCTSWSPTGTQVDALPAADGGTISDGSYVLVDVIAVEFQPDFLRRSALLVDGKQYARTPEGTGTLSTSGNQLTFTEQRRCNWTGTDAQGEPASPEAYQYHADADTLILFTDHEFQSNGQDVRVGRVYHKTTGDLCNPGGDATSSMPSFCAYKLDGTLTSDQCPQ